jgi:diguanylate cyclase (GGDEF)-like protein
MDSVMNSPDKTLEALLELGNPTARRTRPDLVHQAMHVALMLMDADAVAVLSPASRRGERLALHSGSAAAAVLPPSPRGSSVVRALVENCQPILFTDLSDKPDSTAGDDCPGVEAGPAMFIPLRQRDSVHGYLAIYRRRGRARFSVSDSRQILLLATWLGTSLEVLRLSSGTEKLAVTDDLTEVYNARFLKTALRREVRRAARFGQELSLVLIHLDQLAALAQSPGDQRGALLLKEAASLFAQQVRAFDLLARHGNEEFMLVLPQTDREGAMVLAERMRASVEHHAFSFVPAGGITVSMGVATFPQEGADVEALTATVARALQAAQRRGRNRVATLISRAA